MRHRHVGKLLGRSYEHRKALYRNLMIALIEHRKITTTLAKAKAVQPEIEKLITIAREDTTHARRMALSKLNSKVAMRKLFTFAPQDYGGRNGGYTRITKLGPRLGDGAEMAVIELI
ncbi:50S ribosomal protein L17 [Candidatus Viridilinea mediisalina]|uniref:Large ribosomal subunit protein bL17 n=1 Tax=Candidatus Viridilinea mediisalina TaxID=2024553 RepID=A0A2A6RMQ1_9CHLR|nr:50S ribosomal protein L17 [Candidatus Viridilinea mediisalina]PDW04181.1 50S ribosomal protein L17 [Candidatus Viridilinea mediisalina]